MSESLPSTGSAGPARTGTRRFWWRWACVAAYAFLIFAASSRSTIPIAVSVSDKVIHAAIYAVLSGLIVWALVEGDWRRVTIGTAVTATAASVLYGWSDEFHQLFVPSRMYEWLDLAADATGSAVAAFALWAWGIIARGSRDRHGI